MMFYADACSFLLNILEGLSVPALLITPVGDGGPAVMKFVRVGHASEIIAVFHFHQDINAEGFLIDLGASADVLTREIFIIEFLQDIVARDFKCTRDWLVTSIHQGCQQQAHMVSKPPDNQDAELVTPVWARAREYDKTLYTSALRQRASGRIRGLHHSRTAWRFP